MPIVTSSKVRLDPRLERRLLKVPRKPALTWLGDRRPSSAVILGEPMAVTIWMDELSNYVLTANPEGTGVPAPQALLAAFATGVLHTENGIPAARPGKAAVRQDFVEPLREAMSRLGVELVALSDSAALDAVFEEMEADLSGVFQLFNSL